MILQDDEDRAQSYQERGEKTTKGHGFKMNGKI